MDPSSVSQIFSGKRKASTRVITHICKTLDVSPSMRLHFIKQAKEGFKKPSASIPAQKADYELLAQDAFTVISDWYHFAILELTEVEDFKSDETWMARRLNIGVGEVRNAVERLLDFGLLNKNPKTGELKQTHADLATPSGIPSREIRKHHRQIILKAENSIESADINERDLSAMTFAFSESQMAEARRLIKEFRHSFDRRMKSTKEKKDH